MSRRWPDAVLTHLKQSVIDADDHLDAMWRRVDTRLGRGKPKHLAAYRGFADEHGVELIEAIASLTSVINIGKGMLAAAYCKEGPLQLA